MDFRQTFPTAGNRPTQTPAPAAPERREEKSSPNRVSGKNDQKGPDWLKILTVVLLIGIAGLLVGIIFAFSSGKKGDNEDGYVDTSKYQAVFLNNGQVYFGNITQLNSSYVRMTNIFYLTQGSTSSTSTSSSNYSLVKLGCQQIHDPTDAMVINRDQVTFWENLNASGKVVSSIKQFNQQNPHGADCSQVSTQTQASSTGNTQGSATTTNGATGTTNTTTNK